MLRERLTEILSRPTWVVGMGNDLRSDDGIGVEICRQLMTYEHRPVHLRILNAEDVLESYLLQIADGPAENVLIIDAVIPESAGGGVLFGSLDELTDSCPGTSSHKLSLALAGKVLKLHGKKVFLLGVPVRNIDFGRTISPEVSATGAQIVSLVTNVWSESTGA